VYDKGILIACIGRTPGKFYYLFVTFSAQESILKLPSSFPAKVLICIASSLVLTCLPLFVPRWVYLWCAYLFSKDQFEFNYNRAIILSLINSLYEYTISSFLLREQKCLKFVYSSISKRDLCQM
jgi:hypothetical protein